VSEATIVRWESDRSTTAPKGLQAMLLRALLDAVNGNAPQQIAHVIRSSGTDHRSAVRIILDASDK
jgi:hypothetical protein